MLAAPGGIVLTGDVGSTLDDLTRGFLVPLGPKVLKNIAGTIEVYSIANQQARQAGPPIGNCSRTCLASLRWLYWRFPTFRAILLMSIYAKGLQRM